MAYVFINYAREDASFVDRLASDLQARGFDAWVDLRSIMPGEQWQSAIREAVEQATAMLVVLTPAANASAYVRAEVTLALRAHKLIIPLVVSAEPTLPELQNRQWLDFRHNTYAQALQQLVDALPRDAQQPAPIIPPEHPKSRGYVFLSYAEEDTPFIATLVAFLKERGYAYWNYQDSTRNYHIQMFAELDEAIKNAAATISVLSPDWKRSRWTPRELIYSEDIGTPVFLLMARPMEPTTLTAGMLYIDCYPDPADGFARLDAALRLKGLV